MQNHCANLQIHLDVAVSTSQLGKSLVHDGSGTHTESSSLAEITKSLQKIVL